MSCVFKVMVRWTSSKWLSAVFSRFAASWKINLRRFFQGTGLFLIIIAAGLFAVGLHELQEAGVLPFLADFVLARPLPIASDETNAAGYVLRGLVGYNDNPSQLEVVGYVAYWVFAAALYWGIRTGKIEFVTRPLRRLWGMIRRSPKPSTVEPRAE